MLVYKTTDRIRLKVDNLVVEISPLTYEQKTRVQGEIMKTATSGDVMGAMNGASLAFRYAIKSITGLKNLDGSDYELEFDEAGHLTQECLDALYNSDVAEKLGMIALNLINSVPKDFVNPTTGEVLEGVKVIKENKKATAKK